jgi:cytoskeletal protein RodZ
MFKQIGEELKAAREEANITVEYLSQKIKIDAKFVRNFENGDFTFLPDIYIKAFLKEIASTIGLNAEDVIRKYENARQGKPLDSADEQKKEQPEQPQQTPQQQKTMLEDDSVKGGEIRTGGKAYSKRKERILLLSILGIIVIAVAAYFLFFANKTEEILSDVTPPEEKERFVVEDTTEQVPDETFVPGDSLQLTITAVREVYLEVRPDNARRQTQLLPQGDSFVIRAKESFNVVLGHSGVTLMLNGKALQHPESSSRIDLTINQEGIVGN